jgi:hypothetical protein
VKIPSAPVRSADTAGGVGGGVGGGMSVPEAGFALGSVVAGSAGLSVAGLALEDVSSALEIFLAAFGAFGFPASPPVLSVLPGMLTARVLLALDAAGLAAVPFDVLALAGVAFMPLAFALALVWLALPVRALIVPVAALAVAGLPLPASVAAALADPFPAFAPFADAAPGGPLPFVAADAVVLVPAVLVPAVLVPVAFAAPAPEALVLLDVARTVRVAVLPRAGAGAAVAVDMAFAASVSDLTADSIALVAVLIAWSAVVMVLADEVALVAAVLSFVAAVVTFVAAAETALGVVAALDVADVPAAVVRLAGARAVVLRVAVAVVPEACVVVARAFTALAVPAFAALAWVVPGFAVLGFAVVGRVVARFPVSVGTDLPPDLDQIQGHSFHRRDPLHIVVFKLQKVIRSPGPRKCRGSSLERGKMTRYVSGGRVAGGAGIGGYDATPPVSWAGVRVAGGAGIGGSSPRGI